MYDFDKNNNRRNTNSLKWDVKENELPMWVADMDFQTAPEVVDALSRIVQAGIFGYSVVPDTWKEAIQNWWSRRHNYSIEKDWIIFCTGVVPAITCAVKRLTNVGDNVLVQTPVYDIFFHSIENHGRHVVENRLSELRFYLEDNKKMVSGFLEKELPKVKMVSAHATYLIWLDCSRVLGDAAELCQFIRNETGLYLSEGSKYRGNGYQFIRMNIACPAKQLEDGMKCLKKGVQDYEKWIVEQC